MFCDAILNAFDSDELKRLLALDIKNRRGSTDYIDFIKVKDMTSFIMRGVDCMQRPFIAFKVSYTDGKGKHFSVERTFFQLYTDNTYQWAHGTCYEGDLIYDRSCVEQCDSKTLSTRLEKNQSVEILSEV